MKIMETLKKNKKKVAVVGALALCLTVGSISAFFTDSNEVTNIFKPGGVSSKLTEVEYDKAGEAQRTNIAPNKTMIKDPVVTNVDTLDMFTFLKVTVPTKEVVTYNETTGQKVPAKKQPLFTWEVNDGWSLVKTVKNADTTDFYYAYGSSDSMTILKPQEKTTSLFKDNHIKFINLIEGQGIENTQLDVIVKDLSIQTTDLGVNKPADILEILLNQREGK